MKPRNIEAQLTRKHVKYQSMTLTCPNVGYLDIGNADNQATWLTGK